MIKTINTFVTNSAMLTILQHLQRNSGLLIVCRKTCLNAITTRNIPELHIGCKKTSLPHWLAAQRTIHVIGSRRKQKREGRIEGEMQRRLNSSKMNSCPCVESLTSR
jgi:hypothetical protein